MSMSWVSFRNGTWKIPSHFSFVWIANKYNEHSLFLFSSLTIFHRRLSMRCSMRYVSLWFLLFYSIHTISFWYWVLYHLSSSTFIRLYELQCCRNGILLSRVQSIGHCEHFLDHWRHPVGKPTTRKELFIIRITLYEFEIYCCRDNGICRCRW